ncbi:uncharacterized protein TNCV_2363631 [Trichonephila clavipes]|nr:uncharacterized protein TNCV_2363631 [Trichonephila clavipes]
MGAALNNHRSASQSHEVGGEGKRWGEETLALKCSVYQTKDCGHGVRNRCLHLVTGRTRDDIKKKDLAGQREKRSEREREREGGGEENRGREKRPNVALTLETFSQFAFRLTSMWLYYCKLRGANDFESVNQLIVADKMFEMLDSETATRIGVLQGEEWYKPRDLGKQCDIHWPQS